MDANAGWELGRGSGSAAASDRSRERAGPHGHGVERWQEVNLPGSDQYEAISDLSARIAHDFNNLLTVIIGNLDLVAGSRSESPKARAQTEAAMAASLRAADLAQKLLAFGRRQALDPETVALNPFLRDLVEDLRVELGNSVEVVLTEDPGLWPVRVDGDQLESAIRGLAVNAAEAMANGGRLTIETANLPAHAGKQGVDAVVITIADTGCGMTAEVAARVFEPFFTTKSSSKGAGLSLAAAHGFARQSGGDLTVASEKGRGSVFRLYLPRAAGQP